MTIDLSPSQPGPDWVRDAVFYQIFPERFDNADPSLDPPGTQPWGGVPTRDNFFGGDLPGIQRHLDHIRRVGANALYLTPIFTAGTNHRYDTIDYLHVDPHLGGDTAFEQLLTASHDAGVRVVLDAVFHHCGIQHPHFQDVIANEQDSPYVNWFYLAQFPVQPQPVPNYLTCSGCWYLPKLNVHNLDVREHLFEVTRHWLQRGIDGWRLDVPYMLENPWFWKQFRAHAKALGRDKYIVAEVWADAGEWANSSTSDGAMNYRLRDAILSFVSDWRAGGEAFATTLAAIDHEIPADHKGLMLNLLGSHDTERVLTHCGGDVDAVKLAFSLLFTAEGAPMVYYGDEVGMTGFNDPGCRGCMDWTEASWRRDIMDHIAGLARLRTDSVALRRGAEQTVQADENTIVRARIHAKETVLVAANRGDAPRELDISHQAAAGTDLVTREPVSFGQLVVPAKGIRIVRVEA